MRSASSCVCVCVCACVRGNCESELENGLVMSPERGTDWQEQPADPLHNSHDCLEKVGKLQSMCARYQKKRTNKEDASHRVETDLTWVVRVHTRTFCSRAFVGKYRDTLRPEAASRITHGCLKEIIRFC